MKLNTGLMKLISRLVKRDRIKSSRRFPVYPAFRVCTALLCIILCSLSQNAVYTGMVIAAEICILAMLEPAQIASVMKTVIPAVLLTVLIMCPSIFLGSPASCVNVSMKVLESVGVLAILNETCDWKDMTASLQALHCPSLAILILDMTVHFLVILARFSDRMLEAVMLRTISDVSWKDSQIGGILGTTFLKSQRMAEHTSEAMLCRGFTGEYQIYEKHHFTALDLVYLLVPCLLVMLFIYTEAIR